MIKECKVKLHNSIIAVVDFNGTDLQIPHSDLITDVAYIKYENKKYSIVTKEDFLKEKNRKSKKIKYNEEESYENRLINTVIDNEV